MTGLAAGDGRLVADGRRECARVARTGARTFYVAFRLLPPRRRHAIHAVYAFSRAADDVADDPGLGAAEKRYRLGALREELASVYSVPTTPRQAALAEAVAAFAIPRELLETLVDGVAMDVEPRRHADLAALRNYCHAVAGVVGQMCIRIFGAAAPEADALADELGFALQLTNILRDLAEDAADGRFYLPQDELAAHGLDEAAVLAAVPGGDGPATRFLALQAERAAAAFAAAGALLPLVPRGSRPCLAGIALLYRTLLERLRERDCAPQPARLRLDTRTKLAVAGRAVVGGAVTGRL